MVDLVVVMVDLGVKVVETTIMTDKLIVVFAREPLKLKKDYLLKGKPQCHNCKKFDHMQKDCQFNSNEQANYIEEKSRDGSTFYECQVVIEEKDHGQCENGDPLILKPVEDVALKACDEDL